MEEIKVGEYVRDRDGLIFKYEYMTEYENYEVVFGEKGKCITFNDIEEFEDYIKNDITKHSKNIIDLIKAGDYVNGKKVDSISDGYVYEEFDFDTATAICSEKNIKSIVTKEQFSSIEYRLEV